MTDQTKTKAELIADIEKIRLENLRLKSLLEMNNTVLSQKEEVLSVSKEQLNELQKLAKIGFWEWNRAADIVSWSDELYRIAGIDPNLPAPSYAQLHKIYTPNSWTKLQAAVERALNTGEAYQLELELIRPDGTIRNVRAMGSVIMNAEQNEITGLYGLVQDETEYLKIKLALQESEINFEKVINTMLETFSIINGNGEFIFSNAHAAFNLTEGKLKNLKGKNIRDFLPPDQANQFIKTYNKVLTTRQTVARDIKISLSGNDKWYFNTLQYIKYGPENTPAVLSISLDITERKQSQEALKLSEEKFRATTNLLPQIIFETDLKGNLTYVNKSAYALLGYPDDYPILGKSSLDFYTPESQQKAINNIAQKVAGQQKTINNEYTMVRRDGSTFPALVYSTPIENEGKPVGLRGIIVDITELKNAQEEIKKIGQHYQALIEKAPDGIVLLDAKGNFKYISSSAKKMFGYSDTDETSVNPAHYTHPDDLPMVQSELEKVFNNPDYVPTLQYRFIDKQSDWHWVETTFSNLLANPSVASVVLNFRDVTERKQAEELQRTMAEMLDVAPNSITVHDANGRFLYANQKTFELHGFSEAEFMAINLHDLDVPESEALIEERIKRIADCGFATFEVAHYHKDGHSFPLEVFTKTVNWKGKPALLSIATDITERKLAEEKIIKAKKQAEESEKRFRNYIQDSRTPVFIVDENGKYTLVNKAACSLVGYTQSEMLRMSIQELLTKNDFNELVDTFKILKETGEIRNIEKQLVRKDGQLIDILLDGKKLSDNEYIAFTKDITERKIAEGELKIAKEKAEENERKLIEAQKLAHIGSWEYIVETDTVNWSKELFHIFERPLDLPAPKYSMQRPLYTAESYAILDKAVQDCIQKEIPYEIELDIITTSGSIKTIISKGDVIKDKNNRVIGSYGTAQDITEKKKIEQELIFAKEKAEESENRYRKLVETASEGIYLLSEEGLVLDTNQGAIEMLGKERDEIVGKNISSIDPNYPINKFLSFWKDIPFDKQLIFESTHLHKNGGLIPVEVSAKKFQQDDKVFYYSLARDITDRKIAENELILAKVKAEENEHRLKLASSSVKLGIWDWNVKENTLVWDERMFQLYGINQETIVNTFNTWANGLHPEDKDRAINECYEALAGHKQFDSEFRVCHPNGKVLYIKGNAIVIRDSNGKAERMIGVNRDITESKLNEIALVEAKEKAEQSEYMVRNMFENTEIGIIYCHSNGDIIEANAAILNILGSPSIETSKKINLLKYKPLHEIGLAQNLVKCIAEKTKIVEDVVYTSAYGKTVFLKYNLIPVIVNEEVIGVWINLNNLTDLWKTQKELILAKEEAEKKEYELKEAQKISHVGSWNYNVKTQVPEWSDEMFRIWGIEKYEQITDYQQHKKYIHPEDWDKFDTAVKKAINEGLAYNIELRLVRPNGEERTIISIGEPVYDNNGKIASLRGTNQDITLLKKAEQELINSELKFKNIAENVPGLVLRYQLFPDGSEKLLFVSKGVEDIYKISREEAMNDVGLLWKMIHPDDIESYTESIEEAATSMSLWKRDHRILLPDGRIKWLKGIAMPVKQADGSIIFDTLGVDITDQKRVENDLLEAKEKAEKSEKKFKLLNRLTSEMLLLPDIESIYKFIAENLQQHFPNSIVLDNSIDESKQLTRLEFVSGMDKSLLKKVIDITGFNPVGKTFKLTETHRNYFKSGNFIEFDGGVAAFSSSEIPAFVASALERLIGLHKIYTIGINSNDGLLAGIHIFTFNKQIISDGNFIEVFVKQAGLVLQKKMDEKVLKLAKEKAEESDRLKSAFLANMSHEIRTPMNGILGFTSILQESDLTGEEQKEYIEIIRQSGDRMLNTVNNIINISKIESGLVEVFVSEVKINELLEYLYSFFKHEATKKGIQLSFKNEVKKQNLSIKTDYEKLNSILTNLIKNAIKYTNQGSVELNCKIRKHKGNTILEFKVKDTGIGIPKNRQLAIFDRFVQADIEDRNALQGSGLGLSISKAYVEMLGGNIEVESEEGLGSTFCFWIPYQSTALKKSHDTHNAPTRLTNFDAKELKILVVEDDEASALFLSMVLEDISGEILYAKTGTEAVDLCRKHQNIDLVLMDIRMPDMNGYKATRQIRQFNKDVVIIAQTAYAIAGDKEKALEAGANDYISKPINKMKLIELIKKYWQGK